MATPYKRVVLKVSGESFAQEGQLGISPEVYLKHNPDEGR